MSRYQEFKEEESSAQSIPNQEEEENELVCIRDLLSNPNPLMSKIQFAPYQAKNYYPVLLSKLPQILDHHEYHIDRNNMIMLDQSVFSHQKMKKDLVKLLGGKRTIHGQQLMTLREFYSGKSMIYQKYQSGCQNSYFATYVLKMNSIGKEQSQKNKNDFIIRSTKTPILTERCRTERLSMVCRPQIDFNSNFESGNLFRVYHREYNQYDLVLQNDINTRGNNQWFFFSVKNVPKGTTVKFNIVNMSKRFSLFDFGMKPAVFSMMRFERRKVGWVRDGSKINYRENSQIKKENNDFPYFTLSFEYKFNYDGDIVYFSYSIPYTFTNLCTFISSKLAEPSCCKKVRVKSLGQTFGGNEVSLIELTNSESRNDKKAIWILGRQHSGEITSSFMIQGIINFLLSEKPEAIFLMDHFYFRIVPMINIDGVVHGNTRAQLSGCDPNRKWADPHKLYQPIVYTIKKMIEKDSVEMILDLHSHSRKLGTFFYCNSSPQYSNTIKIFPMMVCKNDLRFDYRSNRFKGGNNQTARRVFYETLNIPYIYTIESSLFGYQKQNDFRIITYQPNDYRQMGVSVLSTFAEMSKKKRGLHQTDLKLLLCSSEELEDDNNLWDKMNQVDDIQSIGSDEDPAADEFSKKELDAILEKKPKKVKKTKKKLLKVRAEKKEVQQPKKEETKIKKNDKESFYKRFFSGRNSLVSKQAQSLYEIHRPKGESKHFMCQVDFPEKAVLHKSSMNVMTSRQISSERIFEKKSLCVVGQKVEDDLTINGLSVGVQIQMNRPFLKNRNQVQLQGKNAVKRVFRSNNKVSFALHNQNNFLNKGDILHTALRMLNKK